MLKRLLDYLERESISIEEWFDLMDGSTGLRGADIEDGRVTTRARGHMGLGVGIWTWAWAWAWA